MPKGEKQKRKSEREGVPSTPGDGGWWFPVHREQMKQVMNKPHALRLFVFLSSKARWKDSSFAGIRVPRGSYLRSLRQLQRDLAYCKGGGEVEENLWVIEEAIRVLVNRGLITATKHGQAGTMFSIVGYGGESPTRRTTPTAGNLRHLEPAFQPIQTGLFDEPGSSSPTPTAGNLRHGERHRERRANTDTQIGHVSKVSKMEKEPIEVPENLRSIPGFVETWSDFEAYRMERSKPLSNTARKVLFKKLTSFPDPVGSILQSIERAWIGIFETPASDSRSPRPSEEHGKVLGVHPSDRTEIF